MKKIKAKLKSVGAFIAIAMAVYVFSHIFPKITLTKKGKILILTIDAILFSGLILMIAFALMNLEIKH